jgi:hypothetical protein
MKFPYRWIPHGNCGSSLGSQCDDLPDFASASLSDTLHSSGTLHDLHVLLEASQTFWEFLDQDNF